MHWKLCTITQNTMKNTLNNTELTPAGQDALNNISIYKTLIKKEVLQK